MQDTDKPTQAQDTKPTAPNGLPPETMVINGVTYRRESDDIEKTVNLARMYKAIAKRANISLAQANWFHAIATNGHFYGPLPD